jgi:methylphosphotriester-DNA--protein-cysteine methyltransferase
MSYTTDAARWRALATRDANANGHFIYSVKSTMIYCRPTCPARLARRANISFQRTIAEAEALGFRACKRCKPNVENEDPQDKAVAKACSYIEEVARKGDSKALKLHDLAKKVGLTPRYFHKIFKDKIGLTPREYSNIVATQQNSSSATSGSGSSPADVESFDWDTFDISELADFQFDSNAQLDDGFMAQAAQMSAAGFGKASKGDTPMQLWDGGPYELKNSDTDFPLSNKQLSDFVGSDAPLLGTGSCTYAGTKLVPMDPLFDYDMALLLHSSLAETNSTEGMVQNFSRSNILIASDLS